MGSQNLAGIRAVFSKGAVVARAITFSSSFTYAPGIPPALASSLFTYADAKFIHHMTNFSRHQDDRVRSETLDCPFPAVSTPVAGIFKLKLLWLDTIGKR